jgi:uncharacterized membrane protein YkvA (DUF1232 family)
MSLSVSFELNDDDLTHFRLIMREARKAAARTAPEDIVATAEELMQKICATNVPGFIQDRIAKLRLLIRMMTDLEWRLPHQEATRVLSALAYFTEPEDLIPDNIPGLGFLDDAIMVELVIRELRHEIEAYQDFCCERDKDRAPSGRNDVTNRDSWLNERREALQARMRRRRERDGRGGEAQSSLGLFD